jgi:septin 7
LHILGHDRLKPIDIEFMRRLHTKVNLIPVIAKADTLTDDEVMSFKRRVNRHSIGHNRLFRLIMCFEQILNDIEHHRIQIFQPPVYDNEDEETIAENDEILVCYLLSL